jgi:DNA-binding HxlR family transcriptional regulator
MSSNTNILEVANKITEKFAILSNIYRTLILIHLYKKDNSTWSEIKEFLEKNNGTVNPNTLHFHLKALIKAGYVKHSGSEESSIYQIDQIPHFILQGIKESISNNNKLKK